MADDVVLGKAAVIERCLGRVREEYAGGRAALEKDQTRQDAIVLNLLRACEAAIDLAMHVVRVRRLGVPESSRHAFELLREAGLLDADLAERMKRMVGFRNVAVHNYQALSLEVVRRIIEHHLGDFEAFTAAMLRRSG